MITVMGLGFVGLTTSLGLASKGFKVYGIEADQQKSAQFRQYRIPFFEPHLTEALKSTLGQTFLLNQPLSEALKNSRAVFICVGTPQDQNGSADLSYVKQAIEQIFNDGSPQDLAIVIKSTVPPSTISNQLQPLVTKLNTEYKRANTILSNPEFLREGFAWEDFMYPDRIVVGADDLKSRQLMTEIYAPFEVPIHFVSTTTAEFVKYLSNTLLSTLISYSNEMAMLADKVGGIDVPGAFKILHADKRWSGNPAPMTNYVFPGCGYGGYCLPKDTSALVGLASTLEFDLIMQKANLEVNNNIKAHLVKKISDEVSRDTPIAILGLSFKAGSDDVRLSPSKDIIELLIAEGYRRLLAYDPLAIPEFKRHFQLPVDYSSDLEEAVEKTEVLVILTAWPEFREKRHLFPPRKLYDCRYLLYPGLPSQVAVR